MQYAINYGKLDLNHDLNKSSASQSMQTIKHVYLLNGGSFFVTDDTAYGRHLHFGNMF